MRANRVRYRQEYIGSSAEWADTTEPDCRTLVHVGGEHASPVRGWSTYTHQVLYAIEKNLYSVLGDYTRWLGSLEIQTRRYRIRMI